MWSSTARTLCLRIPPDHKSDDAWWGREIAVTLTRGGIVNALAQQYAHIRSCTAAASVKAAARDTDDDARHLR
jgi:hypothetical protein